MREQAFGDLSRNVLRVVGGDAAVVECAACIAEREAVLAFFLRRHVSSSCHQ